MAQKIIAGNWKMNLQIRSGLDLIDKIADFCDQAELGEVNVIIAPSHIFLPLATRMSQNRNFKIAAQNCSEFESGAYTGEVSVEMLKSIDVESVIIGHSERRQYFGDNEENINTKVKSVISAEMVPILCIGEMKNDRESNHQEDVVRKQLDGALQGLTSEQAGKLVIAYEPVWAIGTGLTANPQQAQEMHRFIRNWLRDNFNDSVADSVSILYGGSVKPENAEEIFSQPDVDGGLIGGASLNFKDFSELIKIGAEKL